MNFAKYLLISLLIHIAAFSVLSWRRVPSVYLGMKQGGISLSLQQGNGDGMKLQSSAITGDGRGDTPPGKTGTGGEGSSAVSRMVADAYANNPPEYPRIARAMGYQGTVTVELEVLPDGTCGNVSLSKSSGHSVLDRAALGAARRWVFSRGSAALPDSPVRVSQDIVFILQNY